MRRTKRTSTQTEFGFKSWGGKRKGAGRKPQSDRPRVSHRPRPTLASRFPVHVTLRLRPNLPSLRRLAVRRVIESAFLAAKDRNGLRLIQYSIQSNHLHLVVEANDRASLSRGLQGLLVRLARGLNRLWGRKGSVFSDRFHAHILRTPREVRAALAYVLLNARKHGIPIVGLDPYSSGEWFDGWRDARVADPPEILDLRTPLSAARTWLLREGWRRHGLIPLAAVSGALPASPAPAPHSRHPAPRS
jgi:REP-associated tyrosine transposase